jgi:hypothetical protein
MPSSRSKSFFIAGFLALGVAHAQDFADGIASSSGLGTNPLYNDPQALLGPPSAYSTDTVNGGPTQLVASSLVYGPWNLGASGEKKVCTLPTGGQITVSFTTPIEDHPNNYFGMDFIVFGNSFFLNSIGAVQWNSNLNSVTIPSSSLFTEPITVSVSPDGLQWYTYPAPRADGLWPTQAFRWDAASASWGSASDFLRPVSPSLTAQAVAGKTVAQAIELLQGSGGGTAFDLAASGFPSIRYLRFTGAGGEVDAVARVRKKKTRSETPSGPRNPNTRLDQPGN